MPLADSSGSVSNVVWCGSFCVAGRVGGGGVTLVALMFCWSCDLWRHSCLSPPDCSLSEVSVDVCLFARVCLGKLTGLANRLKCMADSC